MLVGRNAAGSTHFCSIARLQVEHCAVLPGVKLCIASARSSTCSFVGVTGGCQQRLPWLPLLLLSTCSTSHALQTAKHKTVDPVAGAVGSAASAVSHSAGHAKDAIVGKGKHVQQSCHPQQMPSTAAYHACAHQYGRVLRAYGRGIPVKLACSVQTTPRRLQCSSCFCSLWLQPSNADFG